jgi:hypothetical protein
VSGYDCKITLHLHESRHEDALTSAMDAEKLLNTAGFTVTRGPCLPHVPLSSREDIAALMDKDES